MEIQKLFLIRRGTSADPRPSRASSVQQDYSAGEGIVEESYNRGSYFGARGSDAPSLPSIIFRMRYFPFLLLEFSLFISRTKCSKVGGFCNAPSRESVQYMML